MSAAAADLFTKVGDPGTATTLSAPGYTIGNSSINVGATADFPTDTGVIFSIDTVTVVNGAEVRTAGSYCVFAGTIASGTSIANLSLLFGTPQNYVSGSLTRVYITTSSLWANRIVQGILLHANQDGSLKSSAVVTALAAQALSVAGLTATSVTNTGDLQVRGTSVETIRSETSFNYIASGCVWTADSAGSTLNGSMTSGVCYIAGKRLTVATITAHAFTASKDTYVDFQDNGDGTASVTYTAATNNAASSAIPNSKTDATNIRNAIIVTGGSSIAAATSINQGQEDRVLPIASSIPYAVTDSLGNLINPRDPQRKTIGYRQIIADFTTSSSTDITGLDLNCNVPTGRKVKVTGYIGQISSSAINSGASMILTDVTAGNILTTAQNATNASGDDCSLNPARTYTPASTTMHYKATFARATNAATVHTNSSLTNPSYIMVELA